MKIEIVDEPEADAHMLIQLGTGAVLYMCPWCGYSETHGAGCKIPCPECRKADEQD